MQVGYLFLVQCCHMNVTFFGTYNTATTPRVQTLIEGLRKGGVSVNECNVPLAVNTAARVAILKQPWRLPIFALKILFCWFRLSFKRFRVPPARFIIVGYMGQFDVLLARVLFRKRIVALDYMVSGAATARDRKVSGGIKDKLLIWLDNSALRASDIVIVDTEEHLLDIPEAMRHKGLIVRIGAPHNWFDAGHKLRNLHNPLRIIFFGLFTPLQGAVAIGKAIALVKNPVEITMVGKGQDYDESRKATISARDSTNISWVDWIDAKDLPGTVANHDICLGIFGSEAKATKVVPNKIYQGSAVGCALITSDTAPQRRLLGENAIFVPTNDPVSIAKAIDELAENPDKTRNLRAAAYTLASESFTPQIVVEPLVQAIERTSL